MSLFIEKIAAESKKFAKVFKELKRLGMEGVFTKYLKDASEQVIRHFFEEMTRVDMDWLTRHRKALFGGIKELPEDFEPVSFSPAGDPEGNMKEGLRSLARGEWACITFAGGSATRFFSEVEDPIPRVKGLFPLTPVAGLSFLELFAAEILDIGIETGCMPLWLIMTSSVTHSAILDWLKTPPWGFPKDAIIVFKQGENPRLDEEGLPVVLEDGSLIWTGDGHGGVFKALEREGVLNTLKEHGVKYVVMHNVDNAASKPLEPRRLGFHVRGGYAITLSCVERDDPDEKIGIVVKSGNIEVVEYSICPDKVKYAKDESGLLFKVGHINTNIVSIDAITSDIEPTLYTGKPLNVRGQLIKTSSLEMLNQHITRKISPVGIYKVEREKFFLPTKYLKGRDSLETTRRKLLELAKRRIEELGGICEGMVELHPCVRLSKGWKIGKGARLYLGVRYGDYDREFTLDDGASLIVSADKPYGDVKYDLKTRRIESDIKTAGKFRLNRRRIEKGISISVSIKGGSFFEL